MLANSTLLAAHSPYFKMLLFGSMSNGGTNRRLNLPDVSPEVAKVVLAHVYGKNEECSFKGLWHTVVAADQFLMANLKKMVETKLMRRMTSKSAIWFYKTAINYK